MMAVQCFTVFLLLHICPWISSMEIKQNDFSLTIRMDHAVSDRSDSLVCTARQIDPEEAYIVKFIPHANKSTAHHMSVFGCTLPANTNYKQSWICDRDESRDSSENAVCRGTSRHILFAWAMDAPEKSLPQGVGLRVGGDTGVNYLVIQLHYAKAFPPGVTDSSGITMEITRTRPEQQVGYLILGNWGSIPPQMTDYQMDSVCLFSENYTIYPIGFRTHSHNLGCVTSGYRIRDGKWLEIGRMSPQLPQTFYKVTNPGMDIRNGDTLAARCTMNSMSRNTTTQIGPTNAEEMCNFFIMYSTYKQETLKNSFCFQNSESYTWSKDFNTADIPKNAGSLDGIPGAEMVIEKFHIHH